jgi:hypothetical protein
VIIPTSMSTKLPEVYVCVKFVGCLVTVFVKRFTKLLMASSQLTKTKFKEEDSCQQLKITGFFVVGRQPQRA